MVINILKHHLPLIRLYMYIVQVAHKVQSRHMKKAIKKEYHAWVFWLIRKENLTCAVLYKNVHTETNSQYL